MIESCCLNFQLIYYDHVVTAGESVEVLHVGLVETGRKRPSSFEERSSTMLAGKDGCMVLILNSFARRTALRGRIVEADDLKLPC